MAAVKKGEGKGKGRIGSKLKMVVLLALMAAIAARYATLDASKKRFIKHILKQVPYMPARYFA